MSRVTIGNILKFALLNLLGLGVPVLIHAQSADVGKLFQAANQLYAKGNFKEAALQYRKIIESDFANEAVYYNLANAYFKENQIGSAILFYEKAKKLAPGDREISENLEFARTRIVDKVDSPQEGFLWRQLTRLASWLPLNIETGLAVLLFVGANAFFTLFLKARSESIRRIALVGSVSLLAFFLLVGSSNVFRIYQSATDLEAVILTEKADVLSGPGPDNPTLFSIHEGLKVRVQSQLNDWSQISLENGWTGWIKTADLGMI